MQVIGITGGVGAGKSAILEYCPDDDGTGKRMLPEAAEISSGGSV